MEKADQLKEVISRYWQIGEGNLDWNMELSNRTLSNFSSLRVLRFLASVEEKFQISIADVDGIKSFQDLRKLVESS